MTDDSLSSDNVPAENGDLIECPVSKWYFKRMGLMFLMLFAMGCWFLYDASVGYPGHKDIWDQHTAMTGYDLKLMQSVDSTDDLPFSGRHLVVIGVHKDGYHFRVFDGEGEVVVDLPEANVKTGAKALAELKALLESKWEKTDLAPDEKQEVIGVASRVVNVDLRGPQKDSARMEEWQKLAEEKGWDLEPDEYTAAKIKTQWQFTIALIAASLVVIVIFLLNRSKMLRADDEAFYTPSGKRVAYRDVFRIDRRKWDFKGLAYVSYRDGEADGIKKATIDDLKYVGADRVLFRLLEHFEGELVDRIVEDDEDGEESAGNAEIHAQDPDAEKDVTQTGAPDEPVVDPVKTKPVDD